MVTTHSAISTNSNITINNTDNNNNRNNNSNSININDRYSSNIYNNNNNTVNNKSHSDTSKRHPTTTTTSSTIDGNSNSIKINDENSNNNNNNTIIINNNNSNKNTNSSSNQSDNNHTSTTSTSSTTTTTTTTTTITAADQSNNSTTSDDHSSPRKVKSAQNVSLLGSPSLSARGHASTISYFYTSADSGSEGGISYDPDASMNDFEMQTSDYQDQERNSVAFTSHVSEFSSVENFEESLFFPTEDEDKPADDKIATVFCRRIYQVLAFKMYVVSACVLAMMIIKDDFFAVLDVRDYALEIGGAFGGFYFLLGLVTGCCRGPIKRRRGISYFLLIFQILILVCAIGIITVVYYPEMILTSLLSLSILIIVLSLIPLPALSVALTMLVVIIIMTLSGGLVGLSGLVILPKVLDFTPSLMEMAVSALVVMGVILGIMAHVEMIMSDRVFKEIDVRMFVFCACLVLTDLFHFLANILMRVTGRGKGN